LIDTIVYTIFVFNRGYGLLDLVMLKDILAYLSSPLGGTLTALSVVPIFIILILTRKIKCENS